MQSVRVLALCVFTCTLTSTFQTCEQAVAQVTEELKKTFKVATDPAGVLAQLENRLSGGVYSLRHLLGLSYWLKDPEALVTKWEGIELQGLMTQMFADHQCKGPHDQVHQTMLKSAIRLRCSRSAVEGGNRLL